MAKTWATGDQVAASDLNMMVCPLGAVLPYAGKTAPSNWLLCDGTAVSRSTYADLFGALNPSQGTITVTIATPAVVSLTAHGLATGDSVYFTTTGALPTGITANTQYWVIKNDANSFWLATSLANALVPTKINTSGSQSGTHTMRLTFGVGDGSTTFNVPNLQGKIPVGKYQTDSEFAGLGQTGGEKAHTLTIAEMPSHDHTTSQCAASAAPHDSSGFVNDGAAAGSRSGGSTGGGGSHNNLQPYIALNYIVRY